MPLKLRWPTQFPGIIQPFGVNRTGIPNFYTQFGLPAHEGLDFVAPSGSEIYACADGKITQISSGRLPNGKTHAYGIHIRIQHLVDGDEYETVYAHLMKPKEGLVVGDTVSAGDLIGTADNTGNSRGDHLHLTLKKKGATANGETVFSSGYGHQVVYPRDILDPEPFLDFSTQPVTAPLLRVDNLSFVSDVTIPDNSVLPAGSPFTKVWLVRNCGTTDWAEGYKFRFVDNTAMSATTEIDLPAAKPGDEVMIALDLTTPPQPGLYKTTWQAQAPNGKRFGTRIFTLIRVKRS